MIVELGDLSTIGRPAGLDSWGSGIAIEAWGAHNICHGQYVPVAGEDGCWKNSLPVSVTLVAEHDNAHDPTAVRVDVRGLKVGHLPREDAAILHAHLASVQREGRHAECERRIVVAGNGEYSIYLHLADNDAVLAALALASQ